MFWQFARFVNLQSVIEFKILRLLKIKIGRIL